MSHPTEPASGGIDDLADEKDAQLPLARSKCRPESGEDERRAGGEDDAEQT